MSLIVDNYLILKFWRLRQFFQLRLFDTRWQILTAIFGGSPTSKTWKYFLMN